MRAVFLIENLQKKLPFLNHPISGKNPLPILSNFLISASEGKLTFSATDLEIGVITEIPANVEEEGLITVPAKTFSDLIVNISEEKVMIETRESGLYLKGSKTKATFQTMPAEEFPKIFENKGQKISSLKKEAVNNELIKIVFAASIDTGRPALSGVLFEPGKDGLTVVATDGYRLSLKNNFTADFKAEKGSLLIPSRVIKDLIGLKGEDGTVDLYVSKENNQVIFIQNENILVGRIIEADYPNYEKIIPQKFTTTVEFDKEEMLKAVRLSSVFARETANIIKLNIEEGKIEVSANTPSVGENKVTVDARTEGEVNEIAFNARYLIDVLGNVAAERLVFQMTGPLNPGVFKIKGDNSFLHLIMPIRVQN